METTGRVIEVANLTSARRREMFKLMRSYFANMRRDAFDADLDEKSWVIEISDSVTGQLRGFSTQTIMNADVCGRPSKALFSGDTIVDRESRRVVLDECFNVFGPGRLQHFRSR